MRLRKKPLKDDEDGSGKPRKRTAATVADGAMVYLLDPTGLVFIGATAFLLWRTVGPGKRKLQREREAEAKRNAERRGRLFAAAGLRDRIRG